MSLRAIGRSRSARRWIGGLAVLALALRALVPTGFMLERVDGRLGLVLCAATASSVSMPGMHHGHGAGHEMPAALSHLASHAAHHLSAAASCPFALSGGATLFTSQALKVPDPYYIALRPARAPALAFLPAAPPPRHQAPRGPPSLV